MPLLRRSLKNVTAYPVNTDQPTQIKTDFTVKFWGVRGQVPTPGRETYRFGGNTPCLEMQVGTERLIFDGGTGLRVLGNALLSQMPVEAHLFFTHANWDRIQGFPFFVPAFIPGNHFHIYGTATTDGEPFEKKLATQMHGPNFPVPIQVMGAKLEFHPLDAGQVLKLNEVKVESALLHSEHQAIGFRIIYNGKTAVYATDSDIHHVKGRHALAALTHDADLLVVNTPASHLNHTHITSWQPLLEFAQEARVKHILVSSHDPDCHDPHLEALELELQRIYPYLQFAKEGTVIAV